MKNIKLSIVILVIMLSAIFIPVGMAFAASPSVDDVKVFIGYEETNDWLIVATYNISGGNTADCTNTSCCDIYSHPWKIQLLGTDGVTVLTENTILQCGMRPASIYLSNASASALMWGTNYSVKIYGNWGALPSGKRTINATDWIGNNLVGLNQWVISKAKVIQTFDVETYVDTVPVYGEVLNVDGGYIFDTGIPYLSHYRPDIFEITTETVPITYILTNESAYASGLWNQPLVDVWGAPIAAALTNTGYYFGVSGRIFGALLMFCGFISLAMFSKTIAFLIIIGGVVVGFVPMSLLFVLVFMLVVILVRSLFWSST